MSDISVKKYQTFSQRLGAAIIDGIIFLPIMYIGSKLFEPNEDKSVMWLIIQNGLYFAYSVIGHTRYGQTIGKRLTFVMVVQNSDETKLLTLTQALKRESIGIAMVFLEIGVIIFGYQNTETGGFILLISSFVWLIAELVTMLFNCKRRSVHDFFANSVVIDVTKKTEWEKKMSGA